MPLNEKGRKILARMRSEYGAEKGKRVFYASVKAGRLKGVEAKGKSKRKGGS